MGRLTRHPHQLAGLLIAGLLLMPLPAVQADTVTDAAGGEKIGSVGAVNTAALGQIQGGASQTLLVGADVFRSQVIRTDVTGLAEIMFRDESTLTIGHGAEVTLDNYDYDDDSQSGHIAVSLWEGALRFIGGKISKKTPVEIATLLAALTIRGGIGLFGFPKGRDGLVAFLYGIEITVKGRGGVTRSIRQPGYGVIVPADGSAPSEPFRLSDAQIAALNAQLESNSTDQGHGLPIDPLAPVRNFGSKDPTQPDQALDPNKQPLPQTGGNEGSGSYYKTP